MAHDVHARGGSRECNDQIAGEGTLDGKDVYSGGSRDSSKARAELAHEHEGVRYCKFSRGVVHPKRAIQ